MAEASVLSLKPKRKDINKYNELEKKWYSLGIELDIDDKELDILEEKYSDPHKRLIKMFVVWLEKGENPTYGNLIEALMNIDQRDVAESIYTGLGKCIPLYVINLNYHLQLHNSILASLRLEISIVHSTFQTII